MSLLFNVLGDTCEISSLALCTEDRVVLSDSLSQLKAGHFDFVHFAHWINHFRYNVRIIIAVTAWLLKHCFCFNARQLAEVSSRHPDVFLSLMEQARVSAN